jgi:predicted permease
MIWFLRIAFSVVLISMLSITTWASLQLALWDTPREVVLHPWFIATLFDTYFAFLTFWAWLAYKETSWLARIFWLLAILIFGNIAISSYLLIQLFRVPANAPIETILLRRKKPN